MGFASDPFLETRQGYPLSPILFILALEPLAAAIRLHPDIHGLEIAREHHKLMLFTDDILMHSSSPHIALPNHFVVFSGFGLI